MIYNLLISKLSEKNMFMKIIEIPGTDKLLSIQECHFDFIPKQSLESAPF